jgi:hypothetical protein
MIRAVIIAGGHITTFDCSQENIFLDGSEPWTFCATSEKIACNSRCFFSNTSLLMSSRRLGITSPTVTKYLTLPLHTPYMLYILHLPYCHNLHCTPSPLCSALALLSPNLYHLPYMYYNNNHHIITSDSPLYTSSSLCTHHIKWSSCHPSLTRWCKRHLRPLLRSMLDQL